MGPLSISGRGVEVTEAIKQYIEEKIQRINFIELSTAIHCEVSYAKGHRGADQDFAFRILVDMPSAVVRIRKEGKDLYALVDEVVDSADSKMVKYKDNLRKWEGSESWPEAQVIADEAEQKSENIDAQYLNYKPQIRRKILAELSPISIEEALARMELLGKNYFLFKDISTGKLALLTFEEGEYLLVSPKE